MMFAEQIRSQATSQVALEIIDQVAASWPWNAKYIYLQYVEFKL